MGGTAARTWTARWARAWPWSIPRRRPSLSRTSSASRPGWPSRRLRATRFSSRTAMMGSSSSTCSAWTGSRDGRRSARNRIFSRRQDRLRHQSIRRVGQHRGPGNANDDRDDSGGSQAQRTCLSRGVKRASAPPSGKPAVATTPHQSLRPFYFVGSYARTAVP